MANEIIVKCFDGKENTIDETLISYRVGTPTDVTFYSKNDTVYAQWWNPEHRLVSIPAYQLVSID